MDLKEHVPHRTDPVSYCYAVDIFAVSVAHPVWLEGSQAGGDIRVAREAPNARDEPIEVDIGCVDGGVQYHGNVR